MINGESIMSKELALKEEIILEREPTILELTIDEDLLTVKISDGRIISVPIAWFPRLRDATREQLKNFELSPARYGIHWPDIDEDISIKAFLYPSIKKKSRVPLHFPESLKF